jgi:hypothetical protein
MSDDAEGFRAETLHVEASRDDGGATVVVVGEFDMTGTESFWAHVSEALETESGVNNRRSPRLDVHRLVWFDGTDTCP